MFHAAFSMCIYASSLLFLSLLLPPTYHYLLGQPSGILPSRSRLLSLLRFHNSHYFLFTGYYYFPSGTGFGGPVVAVPNQCLFDGDGRFPRPG